MTIEKWLPVVGFEGTYEVSSFGRVRRMAGTWGNRPAQIMALRANSNGYLYLNLKRGGKTETRRVHTLVLEAFIGPRPSGFEGCHGPSGKADNSIENLRWDTPAANVRDLVVHGTNRGERNKGGGGKLNEDAVRDIKKRILAGERPSSIAARHNVGQSMISQIKSGQRWSHVA